MTQGHGKRRRLLEATLLLTVSVAVALLAAEVVLRVGIHRGVGRLRDPALYTHPFCDDDYHRLRHLWSAEDRPSSGLHVQHPTLGWIPDPTASHSRTVLAAMDEGPQPTGSTVAVFGDSFMAGVLPAPPEQRISSLLADRLAPTTVLDYSVAGYGVDQIYLRFRELTASDSSQRPEVAVFGILLDDIDRVVERFRDGPKPYFVAVGEGLELRGVPIDATSDQWLDQHPPRVRSFLLAMIRRRLEDRREWQEHQRTVFEDECRRQEKETLNRRLLTRLVEEARQLGVRPVFVIFYSERALTIGSWKEGFLKETLDGLDVEVLDTRDLVMGSAAGLQSSDFYFPPPNGHLNERGNARTAAALATLIGGVSAGQEASPDPEPWRFSYPFGSLASNDLPLLRRGWESDAEQFSWSNASEASVQLPAPPPGTRVMIRLETLCALRTADDTRQLALTVNRQIVRRIPLDQFPDCWQPAAFEAEVPATVELGRPVRISLLLDGLLTPREAGLDSPDDRRLGIAVRSVGLQALPGE